MVTSSGQEPTTRSSQRERFQSAAKATPEVTVAAAAEVEALQMPGGVRQRRHGVDLRK